MKLVSSNGTLICIHGGVVSIKPSQTWVRIDTYPILVKSDPEDRDIAHCPLSPPAGRKCSETQIVTQGYSSWIKIDGHAICLDNLWGVTLGTPGQNFYKVRDAGQDYVTDTE